MAIQRYLRCVLGAAWLTGASADGAEESAPLTATVTPAATGRQLVRLSLPLPKGLVHEGEILTASDGRQTVETSLRPLTWHVVASNEVRSVRRGLVTFPWPFKSRGPVEFTFRTKAVTPKATASLPVEINLDGNALAVSWRKGPALKLRLLAPARTDTAPPRLEIVESNSCFLWQRYHLSDPQWPRVIEVRSDALGGLAVVAHLQRRLPGDGRAPDFGWELQTAKPSSIRKSRDGRDSSGFVFHSYTNSEPCVFQIEKGRYALYHPAAFLKRRGYSEGRLDESKRLVYRYCRCRSEEKVPMQSMAWQRAEIVIVPSALAPLRPTLESAHESKLDWRRWDALYDTGPPLDLSTQAELSALLEAHHDDVIRSMAHGDDWGNLTSCIEGSATGAVFGMNRLNHGAPIFEEAYRSNNRRLLEVALLWCDNIYDQSVWWGAEKTGGTRYNNVIAMGRKPPDDDQTYMWRSNESVHFCTKGFDAFFFAYEQTGDPRMLEALEAQVRYASEHIHADRGECRNIGDVRDFVRLYRFTGQQRFLDEALRLFRELRPKLSPNHLFDQGGKPVENEPPFIEEDQAGLRQGYAKPYIIGYALAGLPELGLYAPTEPGLRDTVQAVADFLAESQDPVGGWRYPHPRSSYVILSQGLEHAWQLVQSATLIGAQEKQLDAIERVLRQRILGCRKTGKIFSGLTGWEMATGKVKERTELYALYRKPADRDATRDYAEGRPDFGSSPPEGLVYFPEVLAYYLKHRPASRLLTPARADEPLGQVLERTGAVADTFQAPGVRDNLPVFRDPLADRLTFPLSWLSGNRQDFATWRQTARAKVMECLLTPPPKTDFDPKVIGEEDRGNYLARKVVLNITADSRVLGLMLVPKGKGPFPAVLLFHDHGARFDIGKEKVIQPWEDRPERLKSAREWVDKYYGGRFIGDELARRGYVCFATDMLNWSDRGGGGYDGQQALAANLMHLGSSFAGRIAHEDLRAAEFLATSPEVDRRRVAAMGLSVGSFRTWQVAALSDHIAAGVAVCWMATVKGLMVPGNNQTKGASSFTMIHPGLFNHLDYPDVASLACPKPMLFQNGERDTLFPVLVVEEAYAKMRRVWESQKAGDRLRTRLWDVPHLFNQPMQEEAFRWLDEQFGVR